MILQNYVRKNRDLVVSIIKSIILALLFFTLFYILLDDLRFLDEQDNLIGGMIVAQGGHIYKDYIVQHTPGMHYICAFFNLLGATTVIEFRIYFYIFMALLFAFIYLRYSKYINKYVVLLTLCIYIFSLNIITFGSYVLADNVQAVFQLILFFETIVYLKENKFNYINMFIISVSIFMSIMMSFASVWGIFALVLCILFHDGSNLYYKKKKLDKDFLIMYIKLIVIIAIPFVLLLIYLILNNNLFNMYQQAFWLITEVYSKYIDYGDGILKTLIAPISDYSNLIISQVDALLKGEENAYLIPSIRIIFNLTTNFWFLKECFKENKVLSIFTGLFLLWTGTRGFDNSFHSVPYWMITSFCIACFVIHILKKKQFYSIVFVIIIVVVPYANRITNLFDFEVIEEQKDAVYYTRMLTQPDDKVFFFDLISDEYIRSERMPAVRLIFIHPWLMEVFQENVVQDLENNKPKIITYRPDFMIWGYDPAQYASSIVKYISLNYTQIEGLPGNLWIHNDFIEEARLLVK